ncbi:serine/threonine-protein kinase [Coleofasciculus sp. FACHB-SPT9]|uniref:serine/threonine-protein kinase n=1 Tax=Cyanophyceae TaxID=3028117 RepID=UPI0016875049|nr:serine/threonine-protein kinase [Coleofasciculus sp. FACHB-SPT9]MBD1888382.1 serine/threonine protein kinase [Coleofasciculus sp. FACHB-SPT9]
MSYCINPCCPKPNDPANANNRICRNCGSELLVQGRYQVMRLLSDNSGFGNIYEAYEGATPKILKILKKDHNTNARVVELFQQEAIVLSQLNHPGIPKVEPDGYFQFYPRNSREPVYGIIMEKIDGPNLKEWMQQQGDRPLDQRLALDWLKQLAEILHLVHQKNYFHRDIKPANIMMRSTGHLVLIDFGTAREMTYTYLAEVGGAGSVTRISSAGYTPPEQEKGHAVPQSDFYALGRTFVYLLTGKLATDRAIYEPLTDKFNWRNHAPGISPLLADFIDKLMAPTAGARHKNTQEILDELAKISQSLSRHKPSPNFSLIGIGAIVGILPPWKPSLAPTIIVSKKNKNKWLVGGAVACLVGLGGYGIWKLSYQDAPKVIAYENLSGVKTLHGHESQVNSLAISPDGQILASSSADKTIRIWNKSTAKEIRLIKGHDSYVNSLAISPDGNTLISGSADKTIKVLNVSTGQEIRRLKGHSNPINSVAISFDWQTLASGSADKTIKIWDISTGKAIRTLQGHSQPVNSVAISPDGQTLASASADKTIKIWDISTGKAIRTLQGHSQPVNSVAISSDGQILASASADKTIKIWDLNTGKQIHTLTRHSNYVNSVVISSDGQTLVSGSADKTIKIWNLSTGEEIRTLTGHSSWVKCIVISPDGQTIATGSGDSTIKIWQVPVADAR